MTLMNEPLELNVCMILAKHRIVNPVAFVSMGKGATLCSNQNELDKNAHLLYCFANDVVPLTALSQIIRLDNR